MSKEIEIGGCIEVPDEITMDEFCKGRWYYMQCLEINSIKVYFDKKRPKRTSQIIMNLAIVKIVEIIIKILNLM